MISPQRLKELTDSGRINEECLYVEAYRTPSDHTHSVLILKAKGITARAAGAKVEFLKVEGDHDIAYSDALEITKPAMDKFFESYLKK